MGVVFAEFFFNIGCKYVELYKPINFPSSFPPVAPDEKSSGRQQQQSGGKTKEYVKNHTAGFVNCRLIYCQGKKLITKKY